jgi:hypothetical protein
VCNLKGIGWVVGLVKGNVLSARAKNSENQWECHDVLNGMVEWRTWKVNTSRRVIWTWSMHKYRGRRLVIGAAKGNVLSGKVKNSENW